MSGENGKRKYSKYTEELIGGRREDFDELDRPLHDYLDIVNGDTLDYVLFDEVESEPIEWLWPGRLPKGKVVIMEGDPGLGKSLLTAALATSLSLGVPLPGGEQLAPIKTLLISVEDDPGDTIKPRLEAMGAVSQMVGYSLGVGDSMFTIGAHDLLLHRTVVQGEFRLVIIDPFTAMLDSSVDANSDKDVRRAILGLMRMARDTGCTVLLVRHLKKSASHRAIMAGSGSIGAAAISRVVLLVGLDPEDAAGRRVLLAVTKCNIGIKAPTLAFVIGQVETSVGYAPIIMWEGESSVTADQLSQARGEEVGDVPLAEERRNADEFLKAVLELGPMDAREVMTMGKREGLLERTLQRAAKRLGIIIQRMGTGKNHRVTWRLREYDESSVSYRPGESPE